MAEISISKVKVSGFPLHFFLLAITPTGEHIQGCSVQHFPFQMILLCGEPSRHATLGSRSVKKDGDGQIKRGGQR